MLPRRPALDGEIPPASCGRRPCRREKGPPHPRRLPFANASSVMLRHRHADIRFHGSMRQKIYSCVKRTVMPDNVTVCCNPEFVHALTHDFISSADNGRRAKPRPTSESDCVRYIRFGQRRDIIITSNVIPRWRRMGDRIWTVPGFGTPRSHFSDAFSTANDANGRRLDRIKDRTIGWMAKMPTPGRQGTKRNAELRPVGVPAVRLAHPTRGPGHFGQNIWGISVRITVSWRPWAPLVPW